MLSIGDIEATLRSLRDERPMICLTGGEPLMHPDFFAIAELIHSFGLRWGMTTNATLIDKEAAERLKACGMSTVSVSLDGLEESHDALRQRKGAFRLAVRGIEALTEAGFMPQVTTVFHSDNFGELEALYAYLNELGITDWRPINVEPIGRACESGGLMLSHENFADLIAFIKEKRFDPTCKMKVSFGCSHYLGTDEERMVRDHYFLCGAGTLIASIRSNGDICACLDVENRPELTSGNIRRDDFLEVWQTGFGAFRRDRTADCKKCINCKDRYLCGADSAHTWDYGKNEPKLCYLDFAPYLKK
jgi:radical SAM protein with 4Fe4S-binding SPASM domain